MSKKKAKLQAVPESYVLSNMGTPAIVTMRNQNTKRNPIARLLKNFTPKRFKDKTKYDRKRYGEIWKRYLWKGL